MPITKRAIRYGIRNAPPPNLYVRYGKRHTFPSPTAEPIAARRKTVLEDHLILAMLMPPHNLVGLLLVFEYRNTSLQEIMIYKYYCWLKKEYRRHHVVTGSDENNLEDVNFEKE